MIANLTELLSLEDFEVQSVTNGTDALPCARRFQPDIILSDMRMPGMDGIAVLEAVRSDPLTAGIPFIFLTGSSDSAQVHEALELGANGYLIKPFQVHELLDVLYQILPQ